MNDGRSALSMALLLVVMVLFCSGIVACEKYQYDQCLKAGHDPTFCKLQSAGCFDRGRRRR